MEKTKRNILITGASGYIGGKIYTTLSSLGHNCILGARNTEKLTQIFPEAECRVLDISSEETFKNALIKIDDIIHLASMNHQDSESNPSLAQQINVDMTDKLIKTAITSNVQKFIYFSTFHVYGNTQGVISEETPPSPLSIYAKTHLEAEMLLLKYHDHIEGKVIRLSNAIGSPLTRENSAWSLVVNDLCRQAVENNNMILKSSGHQKRDFIPASSIGYAIDVLLKTKHEEKTPVYNLGSGQTLSIIKMAEMIRDLCHSELKRKPEITKLSELPLLETVADFKYQCKKIRDLGYSPNITIEDEIRNTLIQLNHDNN